MIVVTTLAGWRVIIGRRRDSFRAHAGLKCTLARLCKCTNVRMIRQASLRADRLVCSVGLRRIAIAAPRGLAESARFLLDTAIADMLPPVNCGRDRGELTAICLPDIAMPRQSRICLPVGFRREPVGDDPTARWVHDVYGHNVQVAIKKTFLSFIIAYLQSICIYSSLPSSRIQERAFCECKRLIVFVRESETGAVFDDPFSAD
jgi:hypothetical protein